MATENRNQLIVTYALILGAEITTHGQSLWRASNGEFTAQSHFSQARACEYFLERCGFLVTHGGDLEPIGDVTVTINFGGKL